MAVLAATYIYWFNDSLKTFLLLIKSASELVYEKKQWLTDKNGPQTDFALIGYFRDSRIQLPSVHGQWFSDSSYQIITKLQCNLQNGQWIFKSIALWQVKCGKIIEPLGTW